MITRSGHAARIAILVLLVSATASTQTPSRLATTLAALRASPVFFHGKQVAVLGSIVESRGLYRVDPLETSESPAKPAAGDRGIYVFWRDRPTRSDGEIRGELWDLGRLTEGDPRFATYDFRPLLEATTDGRWPGRDQVLVLLNSALVVPNVPDTATLRSIVLSPEKYENRSATISGRFRGRNLHADVATPLPTPTKWDFVIQSADAAIWISGLRPKGRGFELDPSARMDTGRWVRVSGTVRRDGARVWLEAREIELSSAPDETPVEIAVPSTPNEPPPTVVFSAPVADETDVETTIIVRIQFSRDMDARSFKDRVRVSYAPVVSPGQTPAPPPAPPTWAQTYNVGNRGIELKFARPLERLQTVKIDLLDGIKAIDGEPMQPWTLSFSTSR
ncbi:MAG TPA: Ig-like domain-containing protein [Vicinamibacterales bacterium]|jgi:hypothetical protein